MDGDSDFLPTECGRRVEGGVDRISELPDEILVVILSFLRLKAAAATPNLDFNRYSLLPDHHTPPVSNSVLARDNKRFIDIVNSVIKSHKALSLETFRINFTVEKSYKCSVTKWLEFVFSRQVESLELDFFCYREDQFVLGELLRESRICLQPQTDLIFFQSLKILWLGCLKVSGEDIELFLRNCPLLEQLKMQSLTLTSDVAVCGEKLLLKHLNIFNCKFENSIKVSAPNLTYTSFTALDEGGVNVLFENVPKLVEADFSFHSPNIFVQCCASLSSSYFSQLQIFNLRVSDSKTLFKLQEILANGFTQMLNLEKLVISCHLAYNHSLVLVTTALIWAFPCLEEFKLEFYCLHDEQLACMQVMTDVGRSPHHHLKMFELQMAPGHNVSDDIVELVTNISNNCVALWKMIIYRRYKPVDPATRDLITQRLQGKVPKHIQVELFNTRL